MIVLFQIPGRVVARRVGRDNAVVVAQELHRIHPVHPYAHTCAKLESAIETSMGCGVLNLRCSCEVMDAPINSCPSPNSVVLETSGDGTCVGTEVEAETAGSTQPEDEAGEAARGYELAPLDNRGPATGTTPPGDAAALRRGEETEVGGPGHTPSRVGEQLDSSVSGLHSGESRGVTRGYRAGRYVGSSGGYEILDSVGSVVFYARTKDSAFLLSEQLNLHLTALGYEVVRRG